jgi:hypothetical protein
MRAGIPKTDGCNHTLRTVVTTDLRRDPQRARRTRIISSGVAANRVAAGADSAFRDNIFGASERDLFALRELQRKYFI